MNLQHKYESCKTKIAIIPCTYEHEKTLKLDVSKMNPYTANNNNVGIDTDKLCEKSILFKEIRDAHLLKITILNCKTSHTLI